MGLLAINKKRIIATEFQDKMMKNFTIEPLKGFGDIQFGLSIDDTVKLLGMPEYYEELNDMEETGNRSIYYEYEGIKTNIYFEGMTKSVAACFETENKEATLYGKKVFEMDQKSIVEMMKEKGFKEMDQDTEDGELRISFDDGLIDFFFDEKGLTAVSWGVLVDDQGNII